MHWRKAAGGNSGEPRRLLGQWAAWVAAQQRKALMKALFLASALALAPLSLAYAQDDLEPSAGGTSETSPELQEAMTDAQKFVQTASAANAWEIESSQLALERSQDEQIQHFAQQMVQDHEAVTERLEARLTAERTIDAQERWEHLQKQMGD